MPRVVRTGLLIAAVSLLFGLIPLTASAHIEITSHTTRFGSDTQKQAPCGLAGVPGPGATVYTYAPGSTINIAWHEFVDHPGHYRVGFDEQGDDDFPTPTSADDLYPNDTILLDGIPDQTDVHDYMVEVTLPDLECEQCTIQIIQVMTDKPPFGDGNDVYFHCIDVVLDADAPAGAADDDEAGDCACSTRATLPASSSFLHRLAALWLSPASLALLVLLGLRHGRRAS